MPDYEVKHTTYEEEQAFLRLSPEQQNLKIYQNGKETNGSVARALRDIANLRVQFGDAKGELDDTLRAHDGRLAKLERWQAGVLAVLAFIIAAAAPFFYLIDHLVGK